MTSDDYYSGRRAAEEYEYISADALDSAVYLLPVLQAALAVHAPPPRRMLDIGCGNGSLTAALHTPGSFTVGIEASESGLQSARAAFPQLELVCHNINEALPQELVRSFDIVLCAEVIEHLLRPRNLFARASEALSDAGLLLVTTPYHGYIKNLALATVNGFDRHWRPGWDYGHVKFFSRKTLGDLAIECGFEVVQWHLVGRIPALAKSMVLVARRSHRRDLA